MAPSRTAVVLSQQNLDNSVLINALPEAGYRALLLLSGEDDVQTAIDGVPEHADLIIVNLSSLSDKRRRAFIAGRLSARAVPLLFCLSEESLKQVLRDGELGELGYYVLPTPFTAASAHLKVLEIRDCLTDRGEKSEGPYRDLFRNHNDAILIHDGGGLIVEANPQAERLLGVGEGDPRGANLADFEPSEFTGVFREMMESTLQHGVVRLEVLLQNSRNMVFSAEAFTGRISGLRDEFYTVIRDISQRKMIEDKFKQRLTMESAMSLIAAHFISNDKPRDMLVEALGQIGDLCDADSVRLEFYDDDFRIFPEESLSWIHRRKISGAMNLRVEDDLYGEIIEEIKDREYVYTESWKGRKVPRLFVLPLKYDGRLISALWIHQLERPLVYEDRVLFVMIAEMFKSYYLQQVNAEQRRILIGNLEDKIRQLDCLFSINHMLREDYDDLAVPLTRAAEILFTNLKARDYREIRMTFAEQLICVGNCSDGDASDSDSELRDERVLFSREAEYFGFIMKVSARQTASPPETDLELFRAVYNELCSFLEQAHLKIQRSLMEVQLRHTQRIEAMGQLASGIAHEMNTPNQYIQDNLNFIRDSLGQITPMAERLMVKLEICERDVADLPYQDAVNLLSGLRELEIPFLLTELPAAISQSLEGVSKQRSLIDAMRSYSHPGSGGKRVLSNINRIIGEALALSRYEWVQVAQCELDLSEDLPEIPCYPQDISQVLINILVNASHAIAERFPDIGETPGQKPGVIRITSRKREETCEISIGDNGIGIPEDRMNRIFEPFYTTKEVGKGTGQGLAIAYEIIENRHKGQILLHSEPGAGSEFRLLLPISEHSEQNEPEKKRGKS